MARWTINLNGDVPETYVAAIHQIAKARENLIAALARFPHHGRNYQVNQFPQSDYAADHAALGKIFNSLGDLERWENKQAERLVMQQVDRPKFKLYSIPGKES